MLPQVLPRSSRSEWSGREGERQLARRLGDPEPHETANRRSAWVGSEVAHHARARDPDELGNLGYELFIGFGGLLRWVTRERAQSALYDVVFLVIVVLEMTAIAVLPFEAKAPSANITTAGDALWWGIVTVTTGPSLSPNTSTLAGSSRRPTIERG
jgi:hypothetical protein